MVRRKRVSALARNRPHGFSFHSGTKTKAAAQKRAAKLRREGWLARTVPTGLTPIRWAVFRRRRPRKRRGR